MATVTTPSPVRGPRSFSMSDPLDRILVGGGNRDADEPHVWEPQFFARPVYATTLSKVGPRPLGCRQK